MASSAQGLTGRTARRVYLALFERDPKKRRPWAGRPGLWM